MTTALIPYKGFCIWNTLTFLDVSMPKEPVDSIHAPLCRLV